MPRRYVGGHVVEAVDVDAEQRRERVLDRGRERDDDADLGAHQRRLCGEHSEQEQPGEPAEHMLLGEGAATVENQDDADPAHDQRCQHCAGQLSSFPSPSHPSTLPPLRQ